MSHVKFHLGYFTKFGPPSWHAATDRDHAHDWWTGEYFGALAAQLEAACFDVLFFEDTLALSRNAGGSVDADVRHSLYGPKHDAVAALANLAARTRRIGLVATASTTFWPPYLLARILSTIDSMSEGRVGWNVVTSTIEDEARNFGIEFPPIETRYDRADDFVTLTKKLWDAWDEGALVADPESGVYIDGARVHDVDHDGPFHRSRGPLNTLRSPQGHPVIAQAGASDRGRAFAAKHAELIFGMSVGGVGSMRAFRDDIHARMRALGRDPADARIFWAVPVKITHPDDDPAAERWEGNRFDILVAYYSAFLDMDLSAFDPDRPLPADTEVRGTTSMTRIILDLAAQGRTLRESLIQFHAGNAELGLVGAADDVAANLAAMMDAVGGDGIMIQAADHATPEYVRRLTEELVPRLQELGCVRTAYAGRTLRENLRSL